MISKIYNIQSKGKTASVIHNTRIIRMSDVNLHAALELNMFYQSTKVVSF